MYIFGTCRFIRVLWIKRSWDRWGSSKSGLSNYQCLNKFIHLSRQHKMKSDSLQYMYIYQIIFDIEYSGLLLFVVYHINDKCSNQCFSQEINVLSYKKWCTKYTFWFLFMKTIIFKTCLFRILIRLNTKKRTFPFLNRSPKSVEKQWMKSLGQDSAFSPSIAISDMQGVLRSYSNTDAYQL